MNRTSRQGAWGGVALLFFLSGLAGLIYEILWLKTFSFVLGNTVYTLSTVLAAYMAGLALGSYAVGRLLSRIERPLRVFGFLELGIGLSAVGLYLIFIHGLKDLGAIGSLDPSRPLALLSRFLVSFGLLLVPTTFMGGTLPVLSEWLARDPQRRGWGVGLLYGINTLGAGVGSLVAGFFLIRLLGLSGTQHVAVITTLLVAAFAFVLDRVWAEPFSPSLQFEAPADRPRRSPKASLLLVLFGISGFTSFSYEVVYGRLAAFLLGDRIFAQTTLVATFILGIGLGSLWIGRRIDRGGEWGWFAGLQATIGLWAAVGMVFFPQFLRLAGRLEQMFAIRSPWGLTMMRFAEAFVLIGPVAFAFGGTLPLVVRLFAQGSSGVSRDVGLAYAINTTGCVMGALLTGFVLLPSFGTYSVQIGLALISLVVGGVAVWVAARRPHRIRWGLGWMGGIAAVVTAAVTLKAYPWPREGKRLLFAYEDATALVTVYEGPAGFYLYGNNSMLSFPVGNTPAESVQRFQAHLALFYHPEPKDVLVIGHGFGITAGAFVVSDRVQNVESVELVPGAIKAAPLFRAFNHAVDLHPKFRISITDGRYFLKQTPRLYEVIVSNVSQSDLPGSADCYTREYFEMARSRLKPGGIFMVHLFGAGGPMLFKTLRTVFPYVEGFLGYRGTVFMIASESPLRLDRETFSRRIQEDAGFRSELRHGPVRTYEALVARHVFDQATVDRIWADPRVPLLTDDRPILEYAFLTPGGDPFRSAFE